MKWIAVLLVLLPNLVFAEGQSFTKDNAPDLYAKRFKDGTIGYFVDCADIGGACRKKCNANETQVGRLTSKENKDPKNNPDVFCGKVSFKDYQKLSQKEKSAMPDSKRLNGTVCCVPK